MTLLFPITVDPSKNKKKKEKVHNQYFSTVQKAMSQWGVVGSISGPLRRQRSIKAHFSSLSSCPPQNIPVGSPWLLMASSSAKKKKRKKKDICREALQQRSYRGAGRSLLQLRSWRFPSGSRVKLKRTPITQVDTNTGLGEMMACDKPSPNSRCGFQKMHLWHNCGNDTHCDDRTVIHSV